MQPLGALTRGADALPIIAKIETARGVENLPEILLGSLGRHPLGVMIARGDLMVEIGGERVADHQNKKNPQLRALSLAGRITSHAVPPA